MLTPFQRERMKAKGLWINEYLRKRHHKSICVFNEANLDTNQLRTIKHSFSPLTGSGWRLHHCDLLKRLVGICQRLDWYLQQQRLKWATLSARHLCMLYLRNQGGWLTSWLVWGAFLQFCQDGTGELKGITKQSFVNLHVLSVMKCSLKANPWVCFLLLLKSDVSIDYRSNDRKVVISHLCLLFSHHPKGREAYLPRNHRIL